MTGQAHADRPIENEKHPWVRPLSSSTVNVPRGLFNFAAGYLLVCRVGSFELRKNRHVLVLGACMLIMSLMIAADRDELGEDPLFVVSGRGLVTAPNRPR